MLGLDPPQPGEASWSMQFNLARFDLDDIVYGAGEGLLLERAQLADGLELGAGALPRPS